MNSTDDLVAALQEEGIDPSQCALTWLDAQITELAELLVDFYLSSDNESLEGSEPSKTTPF